MTTATPVKVGTVEILVTRVYPLDPKNESEDATTVLVSPGTYDLYQEFDTYFWLMTGLINRRGLRMIGDDLWMGTFQDESTGIGVVFPSRQFGEREFQEYVGSDPQCAEGHTNQRMRILLDRDR